MPGTTRGRDRLAAVSRRVAAVVEQSWHRVPGGTATSTVRTLDAIAGAGRWQVIGVAAFHRNGPDPLVVPTVPVVDMRIGRRPLYESWHRLRWPRVQARTGPVDVVHATGGVVPPAGGAALVVTLHDLAFLHRPDHFTRRGVAFMTRGFALAKRDAARIIVPSVATADDCVDHGLARDRIDVVPWGVRPVAVHDGDRERVRSAHGLPAEFVLWVGSAEPRKNLAGLIDAMGRIDPRVPLILAGPPGWGIDLEALLADGRADVRHIGMVSEGDLKVLYDLATVFAYPSLREGFGMPVLEAMGQGTAVVTSAGTSTMEVVGDAGLLVDPRDPDALAEAIERCLGDEQVREGLGRAGRARAATFTWEQTGRRTEAVYEQALA